MTRLRLTPSFVVAVVAVVIALTTTSYAAVTLKKNSVAAKHLKKNAVTSKKIKADAVTGDKVKDGSLTGADVDESTLVLPSKPLSVQTISIPAHAFRAADSSTTTDAWGSALIRTAGGGSVSAPLSLPQGAQLSAVKVHAVDNDASDVTAFLRRVDFTTGGTLTGSGGFSAGASGDVQELVTPTTGIGTIDNTRYSYVLVVAYGVNGSAQQLWGANVSYTPPAS